MRAHLLTDEASHQARTFFKKNSSKTAFSPGEENKQYQREKY
jgi:hypothetical protein